MSRDVWLMHASGPQMNERPQAWSRIGKENLWQTFFVSTLACFVVDVGALQVVFCFVLFWFVSLFICCVMFVCCLVVVCLLFVCSFLFVLVLLLLFLPLLLLLLLLLLLFVCLFVCLFVLRYMHCTHTTAHSMTLSSILAAWLKPGSSTWLKSLTKRLTESTLVWLELLTVSCTGERS